ncbi:ATP-grasp domain-containing protein [Faecalibacter sp. LW9]|uniref:ATP-grasp domain-containing protein n=1 Tax=Faecalibacter sp. LW9 TaxID=3103144 RepID=UPI002AFF345D|nr:ATP-grasp domain-containing protein [Faecalibacter sp. LW9]
MNILITAIGSYSVSTVIKSLKLDKRFDKFFGCDIYPKEWHYITKEFDQVFLAPYVTEENKYLKFIQDIIIDNDIKIIIPSTDIEVDFFNKHRNYFKNTLITIGSEQFIKIARDKYLLSEFLNSNNFKVPNTYTYDQLNDAKFPLIGKPKNGRSSEGIIRLKDISDLGTNQSYDNYIFQEFLQGNVVTVDIINDIKKGITVSIPRKELIRTSNGAGMTVEMFYDDKLNTLVKEISNKIGAFGAFNMEFIINENEYFLIDINPRFSAGIGFTQFLGYNYVVNTINYYLQEKIETQIEYQNFILQKRMEEVLNETITK